MKRPFWAWPSERKGGLELRPGSLLSLLFPAWFLLCLWYWWPSGLEFRSDDYIALAYGSDPGRVLQDFIGPQYGIPRVALFHRPLITLSIALDAWIGGGRPFFPLLMNLLVHLANAGLLFLLLRRFLPAFSAFAAMAWWSFMPGHLEAVSWMVGRVDVHATFFFLCCLHLDLKHREGRGGPLWHPLLAFFLGCLTKELCLTLPGALFLLWMLHARETPPAARFRLGMERLLPYALVLLSVCTLRLVVLGESIGGYAAASFDPLLPLKAWSPILPPGMGTLSLLLLAGGGLVLLLRLARRIEGLRFVPPCALLFLIPALPSSGSMGDTDRYYYLPSAALAGLAGLGGPAAPLLLLLSHLEPGLRGRAELKALGTRVRQIRAEVDRRLLAVGRVEDPLFVKAENHWKGRSCFGLGFDRLGLPPFHGGDRVLFPARPVDEAPEAQRDPPHPGRHRARYEGPPLLDAETLFGIGKEEIGAELWLEGIRARVFRVLVATSQGWYRVRCQGDRAGRLPLKTLLLSQVEGSRNQEPLYAHLWVAVETSARPEPWLFLEALDGSGTFLGASERGLPLPLDRRFGMGNHPKRPGLWVLGSLAGLSLLLLFLRRPPGLRSGPPRAPMDPPRDPGAG